MKKKNIRNAFNVEKFLVEYNNDNSNPRISNTAKIGPAVEALYNKYSSEFDELTEKLFFLYNKMPADNNLMLWFCRECMKIKLQKKSLIFLIIVIMERLVSRIRIF